MLAVPAGGATGAAWVAVGAAALGCAVLVVRTRRWLGGALGEYLVPTTGDLRWLGAAVRRRRARQTQG